MAMTGSVLLLVSGLALFLSKECNADVSGKYIASFSNGLYWLQLVQTPDRRLSGQFETFILSESGRLDHTVLGVGGASDGNGVTFSATGTLVMSMSGSVEGNRLIVTGTKASPLTFFRSTLTEFEREVDKLHTRSRQILATNANSNLIHDIDDLASWMRKFVTDADSVLSRFAPAEEQLGAITAEISRIVTRQRRLTAFPDTRVERGQLNVAAHQASLATEEAHRFALSLKRDLETHWQSATQAVDRFRGPCGVAEVADLTIEQLQFRKAACSRLSSVIDPYNQQIKAIKKALESFERLYSKESQAQRESLQAADQLNR